MSRWLEKDSRNKLFRFQGGGAELVQHHVDLCNKQLNTWMEEEAKRQKEVEGRVKIGKFVREAVVRK